MADAGGAIKVALGDDSTRVHVEHCGFFANRAHEQGAGACLVGSENADHLIDVAFKGCVFVRNDGGDEGGAISHASGTLTVANCTLVANTAFYGGGIHSRPMRMFGLGSTMTLTNSILWANRALAADIWEGQLVSSEDESAQQVDLAYNTSDQIFVVTEEYQGSPCYSYEPEISYCSIQGLPERLVGMANDDRDPRFVRLPSTHAQVEDYGDLHLRAGSPCLDSGGRNAYPADANETDPVDYAGNPRFVGEIDRGAYEGPKNTLVLTVSDPNVREGESGSLGVRLDAAPNGPVHVSVAVLSGDSDITLTSNTDLIFDANNFQQTQWIEFAVADDADFLSGSTRIAMTSDAQEIGVQVLELHEVENDQPVFQARLYVNHQAQGQNNGTTWANAYTDLQDALDAARLSQGIVRQIWVANGTYRPDRGTGDRSLSFELCDGLTLVGGFVGLETSVDQRELMGAPTILSGDLLGNDQFGFKGRQDNAWNVVRCRINALGVLLDGFEVSGGHANGPASRMANFGGGCLILVTGLSPLTGTIRNCLIQDNHADSAGGGIYFNNGSLAEAGLDLSHSRLIGNRASSGGGLSVVHGKLNAIAHCLFARNHTESSGSNIDTSGCGGAIKASFGDLAIQHCTFVGNSAHHSGGAISAYMSQTISLSNSICWANAAQQGPQIAVQYGSLLAAMDMALQGHRQGISLNNDDCTLDLAPTVTGDDPGLTPGGDLLADSFCVDRQWGHRAFVDTDQDRLPDWWEDRFFEHATLARPEDDPDQDRLTNLQEYEQFSSHPTAAPVSVETTLQAAISAAQPGDTVLVSPGIYQGPGNRDLDFDGKPVVLLATEGPTATVIDCQRAGRAFDFHSGETADSAVVGFTLQNGEALQGGAIRCTHSHPQLVECMLLDNWAFRINGGSLDCTWSVPTLRDCQILGGHSPAVSVYRGGLRLTGDVFLGNSASGKNQQIFGSGTLSLESGVVLDWSDTTVSANISGPGIIRIPAASELSIEASALVDLGGADAYGEIQCAGLLSLKDQAQLLNAEVLVARFDCSDEVIVSNCVIRAEAGAPYGQFHVSDQVVVDLPLIRSDGDRYLDLDPMTFDANNLLIDAIEVTITEGTWGSVGGLFELRGLDQDSAACDADTFLCPLKTVPEFGPTTWTLSRLELAENAKLNLINRFDFQAPYDQGGDREVLYVKELILGPNSVLNCAYNRVYYETLSLDPSARIVNVPLLGFSLNTVDCNDENDYHARISHNNVFYSEGAPHNRLHVQRVTGLSPDPNGMMRMRNLSDRNPESSTYGQVFSARAIGLFAKCPEDRVLVTFNYLFETDAPGTELIVTLTELSDLSSTSSPDEALYTVAVGRIRPPQPGRPGAVGSARFGTFHAYASRGVLDFSRGCRVALELRGPNGTSVLIDDFDPQIQCDMICMDLDGSKSVTYWDLLPVIGACGRSTEIGAGPVAGNECVDGVLCRDGRADVLDILSMEWALDSRPSNLCPDVQDHTQPVSLAALDYRSYSFTEASRSHKLAAVSAPQPLTGLQLGIDPRRTPLLILGKDKWQGRTIHSSQSMFGERLFGFNSDLWCIDQKDPSINRAVARLIQDPDGKLYTVSISEGLRDLADPTKRVLPSSHHVLGSEQETRFFTEADVYVGLYGTEAEPLGRPIWDAVVTDAYIYVVPVVVVPRSSGALSYLAAARLARDSEDILIYDDPSLFDPDMPDNPHLGGLREIAVDRTGSVYIVNTHQRNASHFLWKYGPDGSVLHRVALADLDLGHSLVDPVGLHVSERSDIVYIGSGQRQENARVYGFDADTMSVVRQIEITNMEQVTGITESPSGTLYVIGVNIDAEAVFDTERGWKDLKSPFYEGRLAQIQPEETQVKAYTLSDQKDPALPVSVIWIGK